VMEFNTGTATVVATMEELDAAGCGLSAVLRREGPHRFGGARFMLVDLRQKKFEECADDHKMIRDMLEIVCSVRMLAGHLDELREFAADRLDGKERKALTYLIDLVDFNSDFSHR